MALSPDVLVVGNSYWHLWHSWGRITHVPSRYQPRAVDGSAQKRSEAINTSGPIASLSEAPSSAGTTPPRRGLRVFTPPAFGPSCGHVPSPASRWAGPLGYAARACYRRAVGRRRRMEPGRNAAKIIIVDGREAI